MDRIREYLVILGLEPGATRQDIHEAHRELVKVWHPDRFEHDARLKQKASERIKQINEAFDGLKNYDPVDRREHDFGNQQTAPHPRGVATPPGPRTVKGPIRTMLGVVWFVAIGALWLTGIVHSFRHHGLAARFFSVVAPPFGVYQGVEGLIRNESGHLGINLDYAIKKMRERVEEEAKQEGALEILLSSNSDRLEYVPQDNSQAIAESESTNREWRDTLQEYRATLRDEQEVARVDEFLNLIDKLESLMRHEQELMDQLAKKFPRRTTGVP